MISGIRAACRLAGMGLFTGVWILLVGVLLVFSRDKFNTSIRWRTFWIKTMLPFLGIRISITRTEPLPDNALFVGNHRSYLDPILALRYLRAMVVAKAEVARWPLIGTAAQLAATVFVKREEKSSRQSVLNTMKSLLQANRSVLVFPEGTTSRSPELLDFRTGAFQLAAEVNAPVVPFGIEYQNPDDAWIGEDTFIPHFMRVFGRRRIDVRMCFGPVLCDSDAHLLLSSARNWIADTLPILRS